ncbi:hypothetical protein JVU11DRAFT_9336 [Chiua virens]|nr:hypothetical protein JVU11DRAFT_9336 [Chiua virens]
MCWCEEGSSDCYVLTNSLLLAWTVEIIDGNATTEDRLQTVQFQGMWPRSHQAVQVAKQPQVLPMGGYPYPYILPPGPAWGNRMLCAPNITLDQSRSLSPSPVPSGPSPSPAYSPMVTNTSLPSGPNMVTSSATTTSTSSATTTLIDYDPDLVSWLVYLDQHPARNRHGIKFAPFGEVMRAKGFVQLSQLLCKYIQLSDLQSMFNIEVGTAILILLYAEQDLAAIKSGAKIPPNDP